MVCSCDPRTAHGGQGRASSARLRVNRSFWRRSNWSPAHMAAPDPISSCSPSTGRRSPRRPRSAPAARARARTFRFKQCSTAATTSAGSSHAAQAAGPSPRRARQALAAYARPCCQVFGRRMAMRDVRLGGAKRGPC